MEKNIEQIDIKEIFDGFTYSENVPDPDTFVTKFMVFNDLGREVAKINLEGLQDAVAMYGKNTVTDILIRILK